MASTPPARSPAPPEEGDQAATFRAWLRGDERALCPGGCDGPANPANPGCFCTPCRARIEAAR
jgi:hypothetical protein